jgi:hypothetical protein
VGDELLVADSEDAAGMDIVEPNMSMPQMTLSA